VLVLTKYSILIVIISLNIHRFKSIKVTIPPKVELEPIEKNIMSKTKLKSKSDFILEKYKNKKDV